MPSAHRSGGSGSAASGALDLHEGISDPAAGGCPRWPEHMRLRSSLGELVRGRCRATNQCAYCARLGAVETAEMLAIDALEGIAPRVWMVLTTRSTSTDPADFYDARRAVLRALQRRWPAIEAAWVLEFTTGYGPRAGGARRPHWNALLKGVGPEDVDQVRDVVARVWCARVDAHPAGQFVGEIAAVGGLMKYLALHFQKESQAPPAGWSGHRFSATRGYLLAPAPVMRDRARQQLRRGRETWRARRAGLAGAELELQVADALAIAAATSWELVHLPMHVLAPGNRPGSARRSAGEEVAPRHVAGDDRPETRPGGAPGPLHQARSQRANARPTSHAAPHPSPAIGLGAKAPALAGVTGQARPPTGR